VFASERARCQSVNSQRASPGIIMKLIINVVHTLSVHFYPQVSSFANTFVSAPTRKRPHMISPYLYMTTASYPRSCAECSCIPGICWCLDFSCGSIAMRRPSWLRKSASLAPLFCLHRVSSASIDQDVHGKTCFVNRDKSKTRSRHLIMDIFSFHESLLRFCCTSFYKPTSKENFVI
jgi:hypothetical protein